MPQAKQGRTAYVPMTDRSRVLIDEVRAARAKALGHRVPQFAVARDALEIGLEVLAQREGVQAAA